MNQQFGTNQGSGDAQDYSQLVEQLYSRYFLQDVSSFRFPVYAGKSSTNQNTMGFSNMNNQNRPVVNDPDNPNPERFEIAYINPANVEDYMNFQDALCKELQQGVTGCNEKLKEMKSDVKSNEKTLNECRRKQKDLVRKLFKVLSKIQRLNYVCSPCNEEEDTISNQALRIGQQIESSQGPKALLNSIWQNLHAESYARQTYPTLSENQQEIIHTCAEDHENKISILKASLDEYEDDLKIMQNDPYRIVTINHSIQNKNRQGDRKMAQSDSAKIPSSFSL